MLLNKMSLMAQIGAKLSVEDRHDCRMPVAVLGFVAAVAGLRTVLAVVSVLFRTNSCKY